MALNANDPRVVDSLTILVNADLGGYNDPGALHNPDNIDPSKGSLMIQEDTGSYNRRAAFTNARVWRYTFGTATLARWPRSTGRSCPPLRRELGVERDRRRLCRLRPWHVGSRTYRLTRCSWSRKSEPLRSARRPAPSPSSAREVSSFC
jgi:hypothetical protein